MKTSGTYASLTRGVSQQPPQDRFPGQHTEQVNMLPDPVQGLSRRHGTRFLAERLFAGSAGWTSPQVEAAKADLLTWRSFDYSHSGSDYTIVYRTGTKPLNTPLPAIAVYDHTAQQFLTLAQAGLDAIAGLLDTGGVSAITAVGKYVFFAGNTIVPTGSTVDRWGDATNQATAVAWVRGGANSRTFKLTVTRTNNTQVVLSHTTPESAFQGSLDTSRVPLYALDPAGGTTSDTEGLYVKDVAGVPTASLLWGDWSPTAMVVKKGATTLTNTHPAAPTTSAQYAYAPGAKVITFHSSSLGALDLSATYTHTKTITNPQYATLVTNITEEYNTAVTQWIGSAAEAIQPESIAEALHQQAIAAGVSGGPRIGSSVVFNGVKEIVANDGGDGSLLRAVANETTAIDLVTPVNRVGQVVRIRPRKADETFYLVARAKDAAVTSGFTEVSWVEGVGVEQSVAGALVYGSANGSSFYLASSAALLVTAGLAGPHPEYVPSSCGDLGSVNAPYFLGRKITYLGVFQDRLAVGSNAVVRFSRVGDYLNFYRTSMLTVPSDDTVQLSSQGEEDDELRYSVIYDRDLVIFGKRRQYVVSGRTALTPNNPAMPVMSSHKEAATIPPLAVGDIMFYAKRGARFASVFQIQPGQVAESPQSYPASSQADKYLLGAPIEFASVAQPSTLFLRTTGAPSSLYCFTFLDTQQGRQQDAWHRFDYKPALGSIAGFSARESGLTLFMLRQGQGGWYIVADMQPMTSGLSELPYLDSQRDWATVAANTGSVQAASTGEWSVAYDDSSVYRFLGRPLADATALFTEVPLGTGPVVGHDYQAYVVPTNPFARDNQDRPVLNGRLTVTKLVVNYDESSGFIAEVSYGAVTEVTTDCVTTVVTDVLSTLNPGVTTASFNGYIVGDPNALVGRIPVTTGSRPIVVAKETREYVSLIRARSWLPLTISSLDWIGQYFNRTQRIN